MDKKDGSSSSLTSSSSAASGGDDRGANQQRRIQFFQPAYMESAGSSSMPWENWHRLFDYFMAGCNLETAADKAKLAVLYGSLGSEAARIASDLTNATTTYDETVRLLNERFGQRQSIIYARTKFYQRRQLSGENILAYVTEVRRLASYCRFGGNELEHIRDRLVAGCLDEKIRERLFQEPETLTLENAAIIAQTVERATSESRELAKLRHNTEDDASLLKIDHSDDRLSRSKGRSNSRGQFRSTSSFHGEGCYRCGQTPYDPKHRCPATRVTCNACGKTGHFAKVCRSKPHGFAKNASSHVTDSGDKALNTIHVASVKGDHNSSAYITVNIAGVDVRLLIDTGAQASVLNKREFNRLPQPIILKQSSMKQRDYGGSQIPICGTINAPIQYGGDTIECFEFYVVPRGDSILGQDLFGCLGFHIAHRSSPLIRTVSDFTMKNKTNEGLLAATTKSTELIRKYSTLLEANPSKYITGYLHKPIIDSVVPPVAQPLRRVPLALLPKVKEELERMVKTGVLESIDASDWVSNMVIARKSDGAIRICADLTNVNKAIIPDRYPLPTIDELSQFFAGSAFFSKIDLKWGYLQVRLHETAQQLTAMITPFGLFKWKRLPFGLCSAPSNFQKIVAQIIDGIPGVKNLLDDIIVSGHTQQQHDDRLECVLKRLSDHNVIINDKKILFWR